MTDIEVQVDVQHTSEEQTPAEECEEEEEETDCSESHQQTSQEDTLLLLADTALLPPSGDDVPCSCDCEADSCEEVGPLEEWSFQPLQLQLQFLLSQADCLFRRLLNRPVNQSGVAPVEEVQCFLYTCQPYFNHVESITRSTKSLNTHLPVDNLSKHVQLLDFSQQLCDRLEQLVLTLASYSLVCLDEAEPDSISHFCIGQSHLGQLRVTAFLYCELSPYLSQVDTGIYKRMRWNVEKLRDNVQQLQQKEVEEDRGEREEETVWDTEYYFLCCEEIPHLNSDAVEGSHCASVGVVKMWSIGRWVQVNPDTEDILDWIMCEVPQASYHRLLSLGSDEPSSVAATDHLHKLLMSQPDTRVT